MYTVGNFLYLALDIYMLVILVQVAVSWLIAFGVINAGNQQAQNLIALLKRATDPVYKPLRKYVPPIGGLDLTPLIVIIGISVLQRVVIPPLFYY